MTKTNLKKWLILCLSGFFALGCTNSENYSVLDEPKLAKEYYQEDNQWYLDNIPFFECSDKQIEELYYYRWKLYKAHLRKVGHNEYIVTEFINHMPWDNEPFCTINAASMHHIYEGRWLRNNAFMDGYINNLFHQGGNNRHYSESIADAAYARWLVNADTAFIFHQLDSMILMYNEWADHFDSSKNLYYIPAMPDATEYTIASVDASGGKDGFDDGEAYRPTINSYMYGNARAISRVAAMKGDLPTSQEFMRRADKLRLNVEKYLWNAPLQHFTDRFKVDNQFVHYWDFIRGRELAGFAPWYFDLPADNDSFNIAWKHIIDSTQLLGAYGFRTNEPSYEYYFKQYTYYQGQRGSQWNGPSWPYQTSQVLTAMANFLNDYDQRILTVQDYVKSLKLFTRQHYLPNGKINLVEDYDPNIGGPIVYYYWSNHYNHSSFNNLVISGLCGIRPSAGDTLSINPLVDDSIHYYCLQNLPYHGHQLTVVYDKGGDKYKMGKGLTIFVDGRKAVLTKNKSFYQVFVGSPLKVIKKDEPVNFALNIKKHGFPMPSASVNAVPDTLFQAIDGKIWYFPEISNYWSTRGSTSFSDWYAVDFGVSRNISAIKLYLYADGKDFALPDALTIEYHRQGKWQAISALRMNPENLIAGTVNEIAFDPVSADGIRILFEHKTKGIALVELECY